jgi:hypothetical protein
MQLDQLLAARADLWRGRATPQAAPAGLPTGFTALDAALCGHGWPRGGLSEVLTAHQGAGLALLLPLLAALSKEPRWLLWVDPPHLPFAPALAARGLDLGRLLIVHAGADAAWAAEQGLRSGTCAAVLAWTGPGPAGAAARPAQRRPERTSRDRAGGWSPAALRRLQLAAAETDTPLLLLRPPAAAGETSPAALRLSVSARADGLDVTLLKQRGGRPGQRLQLPARPDQQVPGERIAAPAASLGQLHPHQSQSRPQSQPSALRSDDSTRDAVRSGRGGAAVLTPGTAVAPSPADPNASNETAAPPKPTGPFATSHRPASPPAPATDGQAPGSDARDRRTSQESTPSRQEPPAARQVQAAGGGVLAAVIGRRGRRRRVVPRR